MHLKKIVCRGHPCYSKFGEFEKIVCTVSEGKKIASAQSMVEKNFLPPENHDPHPPEGGDNCPSLTYSTETLQADSLVKVPQNTQI